MQLTVRHQTRYEFDRPVARGLQQLRKTPKSSSGQRIVQWSTTLKGASKELEYTDHNRNCVELVSFEPGATRIELCSEGVVEVEDQGGIVGRHNGFAPLWLFRGHTDQTKPGTRCRDILRRIDGGDDIARLHQLSARIRSEIAYETGRTESHWSAEEVIAEGHGVCQDHSHVFLACARLLGFPARYVSGYLMVDGRTAQEAMHAWAEAHVDGVGWIGFDISNGISPDARYIRVATGLDYAQAAPVTGVRYGDAAESLTTSLEVSQQ